MPPSKELNLEQSNDLSNQFLIAMPGLEDSLFNHTVTYICDHNEHGAMGLIINQPLGISLTDVFEQLQLPCSPAIGNKQVLAGGPVNGQQGLVLHRKQGKWESSLEITPEICLTASKDIVEAMAKDQAPPGAQLALGYAGWSPGQLEEELNSNMWLTMPADSRILFDTETDQRWNAAAKALGINLDLISTQTGHA
ncbi:YqgE/AlgH family protein [Agaribacterium sp. ZY112]|uniref:YqgE/AlgH family protein n=1 Tax=Agaribacterium sp. ZY112 TaxID=3233574 RepID=UPI003523F8FD